MPTLDATDLSFDSSLALTGGADLCTFDSEVTTFDSSVRTFDATTCQVVEPPVSEEVVLQGGGTSRRDKRRKKPRYYSDVEETAPEIPETITAVASAGGDSQAVPKPAKRRLSLVRSPVKRPNIVEGDRLVAEIRGLILAAQNEEDESMVLLLAEAA